MKFVPNKAKDDFRKVVKAIMELWPKLHKEHWSPMAEEVWRETIGHEPLDQVLSELKHWSAHKHFFPKAGEILEAIRRRKPKRQNLNEDKDRWTREEYNAHWATITSRVMALSAKEREEHKQTELEHDWRKRWLSERPTTSKIWMAIIYDRLKKGLAPTVREPHREIPEETHRGGNLGLEQLL